MRTSIRIGGVAAAAVMAAWSQTILKIEADPGKGFSWPYYLSIPRQLKQPPVLLVVPNNTGGGSDDQNVHDAAARASITSMAFTYDSIFGVPILEPTFPRPASHPEVYTQALNREALLTKLPGLVRIDLQLAAMIRDAMSVLRGRGVEVDSRVWMQGFSASGSFVSRFAALHPDLVRAASIGSPGYGPILPVARWNDVTLPYPIGVADLADVAGAAFDAAAFRQVALQIYVGDADDNIVPWFVNTDAEVVLINKLGFRGPELYRRWPQYEAAYASFGDNALFTIYPLQVHNYSTGYFYDFFEQNRAGASPVVPPKPRHHAFGFPYVPGASDGASIEAVLLNTSDAMIHGQLDGYRAEGGRAVASVEIELAPHSRTTVPVTGAFPADTATLIFQSDSGFASGFARVLRGSNNATGPSIPSVAPAKRAVLLLTSGQASAAAIGLLNVELEPATVKLMAYDDTGRQLGITMLRIPPRARWMAAPESIFAGATQFRFDSNKLLTGFARTTPAGGTGFDVLPARPEYVY